MIMKVDFFVTVIIVLLCSAGSWIGSDINTKAQLAKLPPREEHVTHITKVYQDVEQKQMMISETSSASLSLAIMAQKSNITITIPDNRFIRTNYVYKFYTATNTQRSNTTIKTNF